MFLHVSVILSIGGDGIPACLAGLQAQTRGRLRGLGNGVSRPTPEGGVSHHALRQTPPQQTATAVGSMHPTGMHSCFVLL